MSAFTEPAYDRCDECGWDSDTGALCRSCIHEREVDVAEGRRPAGEWDV